MHSAAALQRGGLFYVTLTGQLARHHGSLSAVCLYLSFYYMSVQWVPLEM